MSYQVIARKYRPQSFADLIGQEPIVRTLRNALTERRLAHAYLFTGARGTGKTSTARIFAKALNCQAGEGPVAEPCNECRNCREITDGTSLDVAELDGATHNKVDDIRSLQESIAYSPSHGRYRVVIVDEVHMLSNAAFNAFLKTLEEPPPHIIFLFATTDPQKMPQTVLSRMQRFDFRLLPATTIAESLGRIAEEEGYKAEAAALTLIAREAAGSLRDSQSLLDRVLSYSGDQVTEENAAAALGVVGRKALFTLTDAVFTRDAAAALKILDDLYRQGQDLRLLIEGWLKHLRDLAVCDALNNPAGAIDLPEDEISRLSRQCLSAGAYEIDRLFSMISKESYRIGKSPLIKIEMEMLLMRLCMLPQLQDIAAVISGVGSGGAAQPPSSGGGSGKSGATAGASGASAQTYTDTDSSLEHGYSEYESTPASEPAGATPVATVASTAADPEAGETEAEAGSFGALAGMFAEKSAGARSRAAANLSRIENRTDPHAPQENPAPEEKPAPKLDAADTSSWAVFTAHVAEHNPILASHLEFAVFRGLVNDELVAAFPEGNTGYKLVAEPDRLDMLRGFVARCYGSDHNFKLVTFDPGQEPGLVSIAEERRRQQKRESDLERKRKEDAKRHPLVEATLREFPGAVIASIDVTKAGAGAD